MDYIKSDYFYCKCLWAIAYCKNPRETVYYLFNFFGLDKDKMYRVLNDFFVSNYFLTDSARNNLNFLVNFLKSNCIGYDFSSIDASIKGNDFSLIDGFILTQYEKRFMYDNAPSELVNNDNKKKYFELLKSMLVNDMNVLMTHSSKCDNRTFSTIKVNDFINDNTLKYIGSINMIIDEYPQVLSSEIFVNRVHMVCDGLDCKDKTDNVQKIYTMFKDKNSL